MSFTFFHTVLTLRKAEVTNVNDNEELNDNQQNTTIFLFCDFF